MVNCLLQEKSLVTSIFSFSHNVFHCHISLVRQNATFCVQRVNLAGNLQTAKSFDTGQPAQNAQADLCQHSFADF